MFPWFRRQWRKLFVRVVYSPEVEQMGPIEDGEWDGLLAELAQGYERHKAVFRAVQILMKRAERQALRVPVLKTPEDLALWQAEQLAAVREANALRFVLRLPIEGQKIQIKADKDKEKAEKPSEALPDLD